MRNTQAIRKHFFCSFRAFSHLQNLGLNRLIPNLYAILRQLFIPVIRQFILERYTPSLLT